MQIRAFPLKTTSLFLFLGQINWFFSFYRGLSLLFFIIISIGLRFFWCKNRYIYTVIALLLGTTLAYHSLNNYKSAQLSNIYFNNQTNITGRIVSQPIYKEHRLHFKYEITSINFQLIAKPYPIIELNSKNIFQAQINDQWQFIVKIKPIRSFANPGSFAAEQHALSNNIVAQGFIKHHVLLQRGKPKYIDNIRKKIYQQLLRLLPSQPEASIIMALTIGIKEHLSNTQQELFTNLGLAHLLAISGLHIAFCVVFINKIINLLMLKIHTQHASKLAILFSLCIAWLYASIAGFNVSTKRALIMLVAGYIPHLINRPLKISDRYALSLLIVLLIDPLAVLNLGFYLSFSAVFILIYALTGFSVYDSWVKLSKFWVVIIGLLPLQAITQLNNFSFIAPIANCIAIPIVGIIIVPLSLLGALGLIIHTKLCVLFWTIATKTLALLTIILTTMPNFTINIAHQPLFMLPIMIIIILWLLTPFLPGKFLALLGLLPLLCPQQSAISYGQAKITMLDVGQGLSMLIQTQKHNLLYDVGPTLGIRDAGSSVIVPFFKFINLKHLDFIFISHVDNDHIGGLSSVLKQYKPQTIITPEQQKFLFPIYSCQADQKIILDGVEFLMLHPDHLEYKSVNNRSCVAKITTNQSSMLLPGDIDYNIEKHLSTTYREILKSDVLIVPHHGSKHSSSMLFLQTVQPKIALVSAGFMNQFNHPHPEVIKRYQNNGIKLLSTIDKGAITIFLNQSLKTNSYRKPQSFMY